ncbi:MAG: EAL domain-containing protein [Gemmobacter sp.]
MPHPSARSALRSLAGAFALHHALALVPALSLAAYWLGGERLLLIAALSAPLLLLAVGAARRPDPLPSTQFTQDGLIAALGPGGGCIVLRLDEPERLVDRFGRAAEAHVRAALADRIAGVLRPGDRLAQLGSGGFGVALLPGPRLDLEAMIQIAARIIAAAAEPVALDAARIYVTVSAGFCLASRLPDARGVEILAAAQTAADEAVRHGPGALRAYAPDMSRSRADRDTRRAELERALDEGQILAHFQPQISADTGHVSGFEALARWQHPDRGLLSPVEFLPEIEAAGLSDRLSEIMVHQAVTALSRWDRAGLSVPRVGVNFSAEELRNPRLPERIVWEVERFDLSPERLSVEILESVVAGAGNDVIVANVAALSRLGCGIDLDDFGTGHSSIANIRRFAVRRLKIDRSFVTRVDEDRDQQRLVSAVLSLAERLGLETVAEGVETRGEHAILAQLGCTHLQGFGIARPMPFDDTIGWIAERERRRTLPPRIGRAAT